MKLPNRDQAYLPAAKLRDYLLSPTHAVGRTKAKFFGEFGFNKSNVGSLESGLLAIARIEDVTDVTTTPYGVKYVVDGSLPTPMGIEVKVRTVWIIETGEERPRFVTAHPRPKQEGGSD